MFWRAVSWRAVAGVACALAVAGCDFVFRIDHLTAAQDAARPIDAVDDAAIDAQQITCAAPVIDTKLDIMPACSPWGMKYEDLGATATPGPSGLVIVPQNQLNSVAGCYSINNQPFGIAGVKAHVTDVLDGGGVYTTMQLHGIDLEIKANGTGAVAFQSTTNIVIGTPVLLQPPMWWRIRPEGMAQIVGEVSLDDINWTRLGATTTVPPGTVGVELNAGVDTGLTGGKGAFDKLTVCP